MSSVVDAAYGKVFLVPTDSEPLVLRTSWGRFDKVWWFGSTLFYGLPCGALVAGAGISRQWWVVVVVAVVWAAFGWYNWRIRARIAGRLQAEVTTDGIRFTDEQRPVPWTEVAWVGFRHTASGTWGPMSRDYVVLHLKAGPELEHPADEVKWEIVPAIRRLAPQVPVSLDEQPPPEVAEAAS